MTLYEHVAAARQRLMPAGIPPDEAALDARLLAQDILAWDAARFHTEGSSPPPPDFAARFEALVTRRAAREPLAYIVGHREFWNLRFDVSTAVLVPRPETEIIVEAVLELFPERLAPFAACDVGTGSGCLAVAIAHERPAARVWATDTSAAAVAAAARNVARHGLTQRVRAIEADLLGRQADGEEPLDLIVCNPPYIPDSQRAGLQPEVRDYEPAQALFGGPDGLTFVRRLVAAAPAALRSGGWLVFEIGLDQADTVGALISSTDGLTMTELRRDLQGIPRTVVARRA